MADRERDGGRIKTTRELDGDGNSRIVGGGDVAQMSVAVARKTRTERVAEQHARDLTRNINGRVGQTFD